MAYRLKIFTLSAIFFALSAPSWGEPAFAGQVSVGSVNATAGSAVAIPVNLAGSNMPIMALTVPLRFSSILLRIDSVSFAGTLIKPNMSPLVYIDNPGRWLKFTFTPSGGQPLITDQSGLLATIHGTINPGAAPQVITIDSICRLEPGSAPQPWTRPEFTDNSGSAVFVPTFSPGAIVVQNPMDAGDDDQNLPTVFELAQNYPNPFNPSTTISFSLPERSTVTLRVYNILGQEVANLADGVFEAGRHEMAWDADNSASGIYFYRLTYKNQVLTRKMALIR